MKRIASVLLALVLMAEIAVAKPLNIPEIDFSITLDDDMEVLFVYPDYFADGITPQKFASSLYAIWAPLGNSNVTLWTVSAFAPETMPSFTFENGMQLNDLSDEVAEYFASELGKKLNSSYSEFFRTDRGASVICLEGTDFDGEVPCLLYFLCNKNRAYFLKAYSEEFLDVEEIKECHKIVRTIRYPK